MNSRNILFSLVNLLVICTIQKVQGAPTFEPIRPPSYPIAVRNPYLSAWLPGNQTADLPSATPQFWAGQDLTWAVLARVDDVTYNLFGVPSAPSNTVSASLLDATYTATHTIFTLAAGDATFRLDFLSPVSPKDYVRQSLPFSYLTVFASSKQSSRIQIYSDVDETWTGQTGKTVAEATDAGSTTVFQLTVANAVVYSENWDQALWGQVVFASRRSSSSVLTARSGSATSVRGQFVSSGALSGASSSYAANDVVGLAHDLGSVSTEQSVTFAIGYTRDAEVNYRGTARTGYYRATYPDPVSAVGHFLDDYAGAAAESKSIDSTLNDRAVKAAGTKYSDILALSTRQAWGAIDVTIPNDTLDTNDILVFMKEISSDGNVNTIDVIYPAFPIFYVMNPDYIRLLLEPVLKYLDTGRWTQPYVIHDIGSLYPNATGHDDQKAEPQPVEETANLLILVYTYSLASGDTAWANQYRNLLQPYADYLVTNGLNMPSQLSTDDGAGPLANQTNLAIKAAVGLTAFGRMYSQSRYTDIGRQYSDALYAQGLGTDDGKTHFLLQYGRSDSYTTTFNLYPDTLLHLDTFPPAASAMQAAFYHTRRAEAGVPLDSRVPWGKTDWMLFAGASSPGKTRDLFINDVHAFISNGLNSVPFGDRYLVRDSQDGEAGQRIDFQARPVVGGHFAVLALEGSDILSESR
ncbi:hypothetical protein MMC07_000940 [Pseudocyphellaria aurata]|nr:hypothetical protein [Pseudocyphellaria aurata]